MKSATLVILVLAALAASQSQGQTSVYRWVDSDGKVHFSDAPPPASAKDVTQKRMGGGYVEDSQLPYATQDATKKNPVTLYTSRDCGDLCANGRDLLTNRGIPFTEKDGGADPEEVKKLVGAAQVPVLVVGTKALKGFSEESWQSTLDGAGYPRTKLPGQGGPRPPATQ